MKTNSTPSILITVNMPGFNIENPTSAVANYVKIFIECIQKQGMKVDFSPASNDTFVTTNATHTNQSSLFKKLKQVFKKQLPFFYHSLVLNRLFSFQNQQIELLKNKKYDLVIEFYSLGSEIGPKLKQLSGSKYLMIYDCPVLLQFKEMYHTSTIYDNKVAKAQLNSVEAADYVLCYSESVKKHIQKNSPSQKNFFILPSIVWKDVVVKEKIATNDIVIGFVGSFLIWHKIPLLLKAFELIASEYSNAKLLLVGYGEEWNYVNELREKSIYKERIQLTGFVSEQELVEYKNTFSIGIMPGSNWYGSPLKLFEYAQSMIPIIAPSSPVVKDLFRDKEAVLFIDEQDELNSIVSNIKLLIEDKALAKKIAQNAFNLLNGEYSKENHMNKFITLVKKIVLD